MSDRGVAGGIGTRAPRRGDRRGPFVAGLVLVLIGVVLVGTRDLDATTGQAAELGVWAYDSEGRRDPFLSLFTRGSDLRPVRERPAGLAGLTVNELTLRGLVSLAGEYLAVFEAPDKKTYILRGGERLFDGSVKSVAPDEVVFLADVSDPLSLVSEREVRRTLSGSEEGR